MNQTYLHFQGTQWMEPQHRSTGLTCSWGGVTMILTTLSATPVPSSLTTPRTTWVSTRPLPESSSPLTSPTICTGWELQFYVSEAYASFHPLSSRKVEVAESNCWTLLTLWSSNWKNGGQICFRSLHGPCLQSAQVGSCFLFVFIPPMPVPLSHPHS